MNVGKLHVFIKVAASNYYKILFAVRFCLQWGRRNVFLKDARFLS